MSLATGLALLTGCISAAIRPVEPLEDVSRHERALGEILFPSLKSNLAAVEDLELQVYLRRILESLAIASPKLKDSPIGVHLFRDAEGKLASYSLPGTRVLLSSQILRALHYESELASLLAYELALIEAGTVLERVYASLEVPTISPEELRVKLPVSPDWFGDSGYFAFLAAQRLVAMKRAVTILYDAGFDPRGTLALMDAWKAAGKKSPWPVSDLDEARNETRAELNTFPPLRNPVVRSEEFVKMLKRIERL